MHPNKLLVIGISMILCLILLMGTTLGVRITYTKTIHHGFDNHDDIRDAISKNSINNRLIGTVTSCYGSGTGIGKAFIGGECTTTLIFESQ